MSLIQLKERMECDGRELLLYRISNNCGAYVEVLNYGVTIVSAVMPDRQGKLSNVILRYNDLCQYLDDNYYLGATIGRYANRISGARFILDGITYSLDKNDNENSNHGGFNGFNSKIFESEIVGDSVEFHTISNEGEGGFPGNLKLCVKYTLSEDNKLRIEYRLLSDKRTPINITNHAYFNLSGERLSALEHSLYINADRHLEMDNDFLPTGRILNVRDTAFDFSKYSEIREMAKMKKDNLKGYNAFFIKSDERYTAIIASLRDSKSGRQLDVYSSMPGIQLYTGDFLDKTFILFQGVCLEAQYHPDGINKDNFETCILEPDKEKSDWIEYAFSTFD